MELSQNPILQLMFHECKLAITYIYLQIRSGDTKIIFQSIHLLHENVAGVTN